MTPAALALDPALPGLELAGDPEEMREVLRRHLRRLPGSTWEIGACRVSRIHYHRGDRCTLRYTLRLVEPEWGHERSQWVTGLMYAGDRVDRIWRKLRAGASWQQGPDAFSPFEPLSFVPEPKMLVQAFPYDRRLPTLSRLTAPPLPDLEPLFVGQLGPGDWRVEAWRVEPVQYRPGRVAVLRHTLQARDATGGMTERKRFYVKVYRHEDEGERAHRVLQTLWDSAGDTGIVVATPIAYLGGLRALLLGEVAGRSLRELLLEDQDAGAARTAARRLAAAHRVPLPELPRHRLADEIATLGRARQILEWARPELGAQIDEVVRAVEAGLGDVRPSATHRELKTDHIFLDGSRLGVVDLDSYAAADPLLDPARVLADLAGLSLRADGSDAGRWEAAAGVFADEYLRYFPGRARDRLFLHYAGALLKEAVDSFRHQEPRWPEHVGMLVEEATNALSGRASWDA